MLTLKNDDRNIKIGLNVFNCLYLKRICSLVTDIVTGADTITLYASSIPTVSFGIVLKGKLTIDRNTVVNYGATLNKCNELEANMEAYYDSNSGWVVQKIGEHSYIINSKHTVNLIAGDNVFDITIPSGLSINNINAIFPQITFNSVSIIYNTHNSAYVIPTSFTNLSIHIKADYEQTVQFTLQIFIYN